MRYWHPEGDTCDLPRTQFGFPTRAGVLDAARRPFKATGLSVPWYSVYGNHDNQLQGTLSVTPELEAVATGTFKLVSPPESFEAADVLVRLEGGDLSALVELAGSASVTVTADAERRIVTRADHLESHLTCGGHPSGHGYQADNRIAGVCYYAFDAAERVHAIVLDTVNPHGGWQGSLDEAQLSWLGDQLTLAADRLVVVFSHHPLETLVNDRSPSGYRRVLGGELRQLLLRHPCVVLWVNGHTHRHEMTPITDGSGRIGFWQVTTASHIDWPQQSRIIELIEADDGGVTIVCTVLDTAAPRRSHERAAAAYVQPRLGELVASLIAHHVAAKRYLVAVDAAYVRSLFAASQVSLVRQGGPAALDEIRRWKAKAWWPQALLLRSIDDRAKVPGAPTLPVARFRSVLARLAAAQAS